MNAALLAALGIPALSVIALAAHMTAKAFRRPVPTACKQGCVHSQHATFNPYL